MVHPYRYVLAPRQKHKFAVGLMSISYCNMEDELQTFLIYRKIRIFKIIDGKIWNASLIMHSWCSFTAFVPKTGKIRSKLGRLLPQAWKAFTFAFVAENWTSGGIAASLWRHLVLWALKGYVFVVGPTPYVLPDMTNDPRRSLFLRLFHFLVFCQCKNQQHSRPGTEVFTSLPPV